MASTPAGKIALVIALAGVLLAGCGDSRPKSPPEPLPSYLAQYPRQDPTAVYFLQWQRTGDDVGGTLTVVFPTAVDTPSKVERIEGRIDGGKVSLDVGNDEDARQEWDGRRVGRTIVFSVDLGDRSAQRLTFVPAKLAAYRRVVAEVRSRR